MTFIVKYHFMNVFETFDLYVSIYCDSPNMYLRPNLRLINRNLEKFNCLSLYCAP